MLKGTNGKQTKAFREQVMATVTSLQGSSGGRKSRYYVASNCLSSKESHMLEGGTLILLTQFSDECRKRAAGQAGLSTNALHGIVLGLAACVLSVPYDMPR